MATRPRPFTNNAFFDSADSILAPGHYQYFENMEIPAFLQDSQQEREPSAYDCRLVVATAWNAGQLGGVTPEGPAYLVFDYTDHRHREHDFYFNKEVKFYYKDQRGNAWRLTMNKEIDGHYIDAVATGTALPYLRGAYSLPKKKEGTIQDLVDEGTSIGPYPDPPQPD